MTTDFATPTPEIARDRWGRPMVVPATGGKAVPYTRCTTYVGALEDTYALDLWQRRMTAIGLADRPDLVLAVAAHRGDRDRMNKIVEEAKEAAAASAAATTGTALHKLCEQIDRGETIPTVPEAHVADLAAYTTATAPLAALHIERFMVLDHLKIGGTPDRVVRFNGKRYIADIKTGRIDYGFAKIAQQLSVYSRCQLYDLESHERSMHGADLQRGIVIHLPAGQGVCTLWWIDLSLGWEGVKMSGQVRKWRAMKFGEFCQPFYDEPAVEVVDLHALIRSCTTVEALGMLWRTHTDIWTDEHTTHAREARAAIEIDERGSIA